MWRHTFVCLVISGFMLVACNNSSNTGTLNLTLTDAPVDNATNVVIEVLSVEALPVSGAPTTYVFPQPQQFDLLQLQQGARTTLIGNWILPSGQYKGLVLQISVNGSGTDSYIVLNDGSQHALVPESSQIPPACGVPCAFAYLTLNAPFSIDSNSSVDYVIDFDARKSVLPPATGSTPYQLTPRGRMVGDTDSGNIIGVIPNTLITSGCTPVVYVFSGANATPTDINDSASPSLQPLTESVVTLDNNTGEYDFTAAYLPAGKYTLAFTCQASQDNPAAADSINFTVTGEAPAVAGQTIRTVL
jgi:hypothetical protein